jgi:hypothetical protein
MVDKSTEKYTLPAIFKCFTRWSPAAGLTHEVTSDDIILILIYFSFFDFDVSSIFSSSLIVFTLFSSSLSST